MAENAANPASESVMAQCGHCQKTTGPFRKCAKCKSIAYCDRDCQKENWKVHKKNCAHLAGGAQLNPDNKPFTSINDGTFLHNRTEKKTFQILIECIRMRQEDVYKLEGDTMEGTIYGGESSSEKAFKAFLKKAKSVSGLLPPWWNDQKRDECIHYGLTDSEFSLECAREKSDIQKYWKDNLMPMKLRMVTEKVYGFTPGGTSSAQMMSLMMVQEGGKGGKPMSMSHMSL